MALKMLNGHGIPMKEYIFSLKTPKKGNSLAKKLPNKPKNAIFAPSKRVYCSRLDIICYFYSPN